MHVAIRVDASVPIGTGHVIRCITLADGLKRMGATVSFICRELEGHLIGVIRHQGFEVRILPPGSGKNKGGLVHAHWLEEDWETDARQTSEILEECGVIDWLIVDHYALDSGWENLVHPYVGRVFVIDDITDRNHECDVLLNQNLGYGRAHYRDRVPEACKLLLGPRFAVLRTGFRTERLRRRLIQRKSGANRLLVFLGGADPLDETSKVLDAVCMLEAEGVHTDVVVGVANPRAEHIRARCESMSGTSYHRGVDNMHELMANAHLGVFSAGTATWERCAVGLPAIVVSIAENQRLIAEQTASAGASIYLGEAKNVSPKLLADAVQNVLSLPETLERMSNAAYRLVDGAGLARVLAAITGGPFRLSIVSDRDSWINDYLINLADEWTAL